MMNTIKIIALASLVLSHCLATDTDHEEPSADLENILKKSELQIHEKTYPLHLSDKVKEQITNNKEIQEQFIKSIKRLQSNNIDTKIKGYNVLIKDNELVCAPYLGWNAKK